MKIKKIRYSRKKVFLYLFLFLFLVGLGIGFAFVTTTLYVQGTANVINARWDIHFDNFQAMNGSVTPTSQPTITDSSVSFAARVDNAGDFYGFTIDIENEGTINARISDFSITPDFSTIDYIDSSIVYNDGSPVAIGDTLASNKTKTIKVLLKYKEGLSEDIYPSSDQVYNVTVSLRYEQYSGDITEFALGDYFTLVPDEATATTTTAGFSGSTPTADQTLWRVIKVYDNDTVDAVSEYVSTNEITISGTDGFTNYVAGLQDIASKYAKSGYTVGTRMMGYDGQTSIIGDTSAFDGTTNTPPSTTTTLSPTTGTGEEYSGGVLGDTLYLKDYQLVSSVYSSDTATYGSNGLKAYKVGTTTATNYWLASRHFFYLSSTYFVFYGRCMNASGGLGIGNFRFFRSGWSDRSGSVAVRPILTLKSGITIASGTGTKTDPYEFE